MSEPFLALCFIVPSLTSFVALAATGSSIIAIVVVLVIFNGLRALIPGLSYQP